MPGRGGVTLGECAACDPFSRIMAHARACVFVCVILRVVVEVRKHFPAKMTCELELHPEG